ncbi:hypothetical protein D3C84_963370 [compost metagenome]
MAVYAGNMIYCFRFVAYFGDILHIDYFTICIVDNSIGNIIGIFKFTACLYIKHLTVKIDASSWDIGSFTLKTPHHEV